MAKYIKDDSQQMPDYEGPVYSGDFQEEQEPQETPEQAIARQIEERRKKVTPSPFPAPAKPSPGSLAKGATEPPITAVLNHALNVANKKGRTEAERKRDWRKANRDHYLQKNREYVRAYRLKRKGQSNG